MWMLLLYLHVNQKSDYDMMISRTANKRRKGKIHVSLSKQNVFKTPCFMQKKYLNICSLDVRGLRALNPWTMKYA